MYVHGARVIYEKGGEGSTALDIYRDRYREELYERTSTGIWGWNMVRGAKWRETVKECTSARSIFKERGRERTLLCAVAEP